MNDKITYKLLMTGERLLNLPFIRWAFMSFCLARYYVSSILLRDSYKALSALLRYQRIISTIKNGKVPDFITNKISDLVAGKVDDDTCVNGFISSYVKTKEAGLMKEEFQGYGKAFQLRIKYPKENDYPQRQGDLLVLKPYVGEREKGVLFIQYNDAVNKFCAIYDVERLAKYYRFVIEPSTWGYQDPIFFLLMGLGTDIIIESQCEQDFNYIKSIGNGLHPIRLGAGDWVDPDVFHPNGTLNKKYDVIMIASWLSLKRHELLFKSLNRIKTYIKKVTIIGYPISGRTLSHIVKESKKHNVADIIVFYENLPQEEVSKLLQQAKINIMLSKREGANKALYESLFSNVPVILTSSNIGVNRDHINEHTGICSTDEELPNNILYMVNNYERFAPRQWAIENTGYKNSSRVLNKFLKDIALAKGERWTRDIYMKKNFTNARYVNDEDMSEADREITRLTRFLRD